MKMIELDMLAVVLDTSSASSTFSEAKHKIKHSAKISKSNKRIIVFKFSLSCPNLLKHILQHLFEYRIEMFCILLHCCIIYILQSNLCFWVGSSRLVQNHILLAGIYADFLAWKLYSIQRKEVQMVHCMSGVNILFDIYSVT